jgi:hypothetical protein
MQRGSAVLKEMGNLFKRRHERQAMENLHIFCPLETFLHLSDRILDALEYFTEKVPDLHLAPA